MTRTSKVRRTRKTQSGLPVGKVIRGLMQIRKSGRKYVPSVTLIRLVRRFATA